MFKYSLNLQPLVIVVLISLLFASIFSSNLLLVIESLVVFYLVYKFTWRRNEPPVVFLSILLQLIQVVSILVISSFKNESIQNFTDFPYHIEEAFHYSLFGLLFLSIGINIVVHKLPPKNTIQELETEIYSYDSDRVILWYFIFAMSLPFLQGLSFRLGSFQQIGYKFLELKWTLFFIFYYVSAYENKRILFFLSIVLLEVILGFAGFFSNYKEVAFALVVCFLTFKYKLSFKQYFVLFFGILVISGISVVWQYSKNDYRQYLSGETSQQVVNVSREEALSKFFEINKDFDLERFYDGTEQLFRRVSYLNYFSAAIDYVPARKPHQNGALVWEATTRSFMPRFLFPNKEIVDDSKRTMEYTGITVTGAESATSISMSYVSELYVDFGFTFLLPAMLLLGVLIGIIYRYLYFNSYSPMWFYAYLIPLIFSIYLFEMALSKLLPSIMLYFVIIFLFNRFLAKRVDKYFRNV